MSAKASLMKTLKAANEALKAGDAASARGLAKEAIEADGDAYEAWVMDGKAANALGALDDAVKSYERAIEIRSEHPAAYQGLNETFAAKGDVVGRLRALRALVDAHRASGKVDKLVEFLKQACACAWENAQWSRVIEFCGEMGEFRTGEVDEVTRVESVKRACDGALALRDARAAEAGEAAVQMLRSKTIASKAEEEAVRKLGARASHAVDDEDLATTLRAWLSEDVANASYNSRTHAAELDRLDARLAAALSASVDCDFDVRACAREALTEATVLIDRWGEVVIDLVEPLCVEIVAALELGLDCEEEGWDDNEVEDEDEAKVIRLLERVLALRANTIASGWLALRDSRRSGAFTHSCRPATPPREDARGLLTPELRDEIVTTLNRDDESKVSHASAAIGWLALAESMLVGGERADVHALQAATTAMKIMREDITTDALPKMSRRVLMVHAEAMLRVGMFQEARAAFVVLEGPRAARGLATCAFNAHPPDYERALQLLSDAAETYPNVRRVGVELGWLMTIAGSSERRAEGLETLERACGVKSGEPLSTTTPADASARLGIARWRAQVSAAKGPGSAHEALLIGAAGDSAHRAAAFAHLGLSCGASGDDARAQKCHARALALDAADPTSGPVAFTNALDANDDAKATSICRAALAVDSRCSWAANRLAPMCARIGDHSGAIGALQVVLRVSPRNASAWEALGASYNSLGRHSAALKAFERAMELSDEAGEGVRSYAASQTGHIYLALGSSADAIEAYDKALSDGVDHLAALFGSASAHSYYAKGALRWGAPGRAAVSLKAATKAGKRAVEIMGDGATATVWKLLGDIHHLAAQVNDPALGKDFTSMLAARTTEARSAVEAYEKALNLKPDRPGRWRDVVAALRLQTEIHKLSGDVAAAEASAAKAWERAAGYLRVAPGDPFAWFAAAAIDDPAEISDAVRTERKITALSRAVALNPTFAQAWCALGRLYLSSGDVGEATLSLDSARIADPSSGDAWTATAALHIATGKLDEGRGAFRMAAALGAGAEADLGCALTACASGLTYAKDAYAAARRASESLPVDSTAAIALALCAECRGLFEEAEDAAAHAVASLENVPALGGDPNVIRTVAEECRARLSQRRLDDSDSTASTSVDGDFESTLERAKLLVHARPGDLKMQDALTRVASCAPDHQTVVSALSACPPSSPNGDYRVQSSLARAAAACALNASTVVGDAEGSARADRFVARATMLDPSSTESLELLNIVLDRRKGIVREATQSEAHELHAALKSALTQSAAGDSASAEAAARAVVNREPITDAAQAAARLILASFLIERSRRDGDAKPAKEAIKVLAKIPSEAGARVADLAAALADAVSG